MKKIKIKYTHAATDLYFEGSFRLLKNITKSASAILITDENVFNAHKGKFKNWNTIVLKPGEDFKVQNTVDAIIHQLIEMEADRTTILIGVGGGVVTDITGYVASIYMRGIRFGFVPTSILGLVDASIGGKNGIDVAVFKNMIGAIRQPEFILHDLSFLNSLPLQEWENGFAEIIKHACIGDEKMFIALEKTTLKQFQKDKKLLAALIQQNALLKSKVVQRDEFEKNERRLLNFGHTLGHALENQYELLHGQAISIGMTYACHVSESLTGFKNTARVVALLEKYNLPTYASFNKKKVFDVLKMDKKRERNEINFILLKKIGMGAMHPISLKRLENILESN